MHGEGHAGGRGDGSGDCPLVVQVNGCDDVYGDSEAAWVKVERELWQYCEDEPGVCLLRDAHDECDFVCEPRERGVLCDAECAERDHFQRGVEVGCAEGLPWLHLLRCAYEVPGACPEGGVVDEGLPH